MLGAPLLWDPHWIAVAGWRQAAETCSSLRCLRARVPLAAAQPCTAYDIHLNDVVVAVCQSEVLCAPSITLQLWRVGAWGEAACPLSCKAVLKSPLAACCFTQSTVLLCTQSTMVVVSCNYKATGKVCLSAVTLRVYLHATPRHEE
jgi:hypothetical protein